MDVSQRWHEHLRRASKKSKLEIRCPLCRQLVQTAESLQNGTVEAAFAGFERHLSDRHAQLLADKAEKKEETAWIAGLWEVAQSPGERCVAAFVPFFVLEFFLTFCLALRFGGFWPSLSLTSHKGRG